MKQKENSLPIGLELAFEDAIVKLDGWTYGGPEPTVGYNSKDVPVSEIFEHVGGIHGFASQDLYLLVCDVAQGFRGGEEALGYPCDNPNGKTFAELADCMRKLLVARAAMFQRRRLRQADA
jgi:hypothetical protein